MVGCAGAIVAPPSTPPVLLVDRLRQGGPEALDGQPVMPESTSVYLTSAIVSLVLAVGVFYFARSSCRRQELTRSVTTSAPPRPGLGRGRRRGIVTLAGSGSHGATGDAGAPAIHVRPDPASDARPRTPPYFTAPGSSASSVVSRT